MTKRNRRLTACTTAAAGLLWATAACCHTVRLGTLEIVHPAITTHTDGVCVRFIIRNHGAAAEQFVGVRFGTAEGLLPMTIPPGGTLDLRRGTCVAVPAIPAGLAPGLSMIPGEMRFRSTGWAAIDYMADAPE
jgi:hypothetical protein